MCSAWCETQDRLLKELLSLDLWGMSGGDLPWTLLEINRALRAKADGCRKHSDQNKTHSGEIAC